MAREIEGTDQFERWYLGLTAVEQTAVDEAVEALAAGGPGLGRPLVDTLTGSRLPNLKELRPRGGFLRCLFVFDPRRTAILLLGGDKRDRWADWHRDAIPEAERLYEVYLAELRKEGLIG